MTEPYPITARQREVLRFIVGYQAAHGGVSPTQDEIARAVGMAGKSSVCRVLHGLQERGWITRLHGRRQAIEVLAALPVPRAPDGAPLYAVSLPALCERLPAHD